MSLGERARLLMRRRGAYRSALMGPEGKTLTDPGKDVMADLARFCYATRSTAIVTPTGIDPIASAQAEGRRQVYLRILAQLHLDDSAILAALEQSHD